MTEDGIELSPTRQRSPDITTMGNLTQSYDDNIAIQRAVDSSEEPGEERGKVQVLAIMVALCVRSLLLLHVIVIQLGSTE